MKTLSFEKLLLQAIFTCMAADGHIDEREINLMKSIIEKSNLFSNLNVQEEINNLITEFNNDSQMFIKQFFEKLEKSNLSEDEELMLIDYAIQIIKADEQIEYSEIKFFKNIRYRLKISDEKILKQLPNTEIFIEKDIITDNFLKNLTSKYFENISFPQIDKDFISKKMSE